MSRWAFALTLCLALVPATQASDDPSDARAQQRYVKQLLTILRTTKSPETFEVTLGLLEKTGAAPRDISIVVLKNAERLGIFRQNSLQVDFDQISRKLQARRVVEALHRMTERAATVPLETVEISTVREAAQQPDGQPSLLNEKLRHWGKPVEEFTPSALKPVDFRIPVLPPLKSGTEPDPSTQQPDEARVLRALPKLGENQYYDNIQIVTELMKNDLAPPRFFPLVGPAQLHQCQWKCTVYYDETTETTGRRATTSTVPRVLVLYIDTNALHLYQRGDADKPDK